MHTIFYLSGFHFILSLLPSFHLIAPYCLSIFLRTHSVIFVKLLYV